MTIVDPLTFDLTATLVGEKDCTLARRTAQQIVNKEKDATILPNCVLRFRFFVIPKFAFLIIVTVETSASGIEFDASRCNPKQIDRIEARYFQRTRELYVLNIPKYKIIPEGKQ